MKHSVLCRYVDDEKHRALEMMSIVITDRDLKILEEVSRWKGILGRQIQLLCGFTCERVCNKRLKLLIDEGLLSRKRYIYGVAGLLSITEKARNELNISLPISEIRLDQIIHDIAVTDTAIYVINKYGITSRDITSEKELRNKDGFTKRRHLPDFIFTKDEQTYCVEVELSAKAKDRLNANVKNNFLTYDHQKWVVPENKVKIRNMLEDSVNVYPNIEIIDLEVVNEFIRRAIRK